jgi:DNA-binding NarL/FixJ family response regulator
MPRAVLIVENQTTRGHRLAELLESRFDTIRTASSAPEAMEVAIELRPDLVITPFPVVMKSGELLCACLKRDPRTSGSKLLAYSDWSWANTRAKALAAGCEAFVPATADEEELLSAVDRIFGHPTSLPRRRRKADNAAAS